MEQADELIIEYYPENISGLESFVNKCPRRQRVVLDIGTKNFVEDSDYLALKEVISKLKNEIALRIAPTNITGIQACYKYKIPFFIKQNCSDYDGVACFAELGVTDIYISDSFCFHLKAIKKYLRSIAPKCKIRVMPNVAQSTCPFERPEKKFFIRPEDVYLYEDYIDYMEFFDNAALKNIKKLYRAYAIDKKYEGLMSEIISGAPENIFNECVSPDYAARRISCNKHCNSQTRCSVCSSFMKLAETLNSKKYIIKVQKDD